MMSIVAKDKKIGERAQEKVKESLQRLMNQASSVSADQFSENKIFFVAPKNAHTSSFDLTGLNMHVLNTIIEAKRSMKVSDFRFKQEYFSLYKNYFEQKATSAMSVQTAYYAMKGLKTNVDQVFLKDTSKSYFTVDGNTNTILYEVVNMMGSLAKLKTVKKAEIIQINNPSKVTDAMDKVKIQDEAKVLVELKKSDIVEMPWTSHLLALEFEAENGAFVFINKTFEIKTTIVQEIGVSVSQNAH